MINKSKESLTRYYFGVSEVKHKGVVTNTSLGSSADFLMDRLSDIPYRNGRVPIEHGYRPDLTSNTFYETSRYWWLLLRYNDMKDPFEDYQPGTNIKIPDVL